MNRKNIESVEDGPHVNVGLLPLQKDVELYEMIDMIVRKNLPLSITEDPDYRYVCTMSNHATRIH